MNDTTKTGAVAITSTMLAGVIIWLCGVMKLPVPPVEVAGTIGAGMLYGAHLFASWVNARFPPKAPPVAVAVVAPVPAAPAPAAP